MACSTDLPGQLTFQWKEDAVKPITLDLKKDKKICEDCALASEGCRTNGMPGRGAKGGILFLGENPGAEEDTQGKPFVGSAGKILQALVEDFGLSQYAFYTNITRCKGESIKRKPTIDEIRTCRKHLDKELEVIRPKLIVALGQYPAKGMTDNNLASVTKLRGSTSLYKGIPVFYMNHPSAVHYDRKVLDYMKEDFQKIRELWGKGVPAEGKGIYYLIRPWSKLVEDLKVGVCSLDIETNQFDPYGPNARIMCMSIATNGETVYYKSFAPHGAAPGSKELIDAIELMRGIRTLVCHKATFDMGWLTYKLPIDHWLWKIEWQCTLISIQFKDEYYPNTGLGHLAEVYAHTPKLPMPECIKAGYPKGWDTEENLKAEKRYNCRDSIAGWRLWKEIHPRLRQEAGKEVTDKIREGRAYSWVSSNLKTVVRMRHSGIRLSQKRLEGLNTELTKKVFACEQHLRQTGVNFSSTLAVRKYLFEKLKLPILKRTDKTKEPALDREVLQQLEKKDRTGWVKRFANRKKFLKIRDTYCKNMREWGDIAHPEVFIARTADDEAEGGANTGRVTCKGFINLPRDDEAKPNEMTIKKCIVSRYGSEGVIVALDYSQMEMRILGDQSRDPRLLEAFDKKLDLHTFAAAQVAGCKMKDVDKLMRQKAKAVNFGLIFGQTAYGLSQGTGMSEGEAESFIARYFARFVQVQQYIRRQYNEAAEFKIIHSPIGRVFHLANAKWTYDKRGRQIPNHDMRKAVNSPIQSAANDFCTEAIRQVQRFIDNGAYNAHCILTVYDSIVMDWRKDHLEASELLMPDMLKEVFETKPKAALRDVGWSVSVPIEFEVKSGPSLGECK
jgi:uracil-DNA glycosylase family 4